MVCASHVEEMKLSVLPLPSFNRKVKKQGRSCGMRTGMQLSRLGSSMRSWVAGIWRCGGCEWLKTSMGSITLLLHGWGPEW